MIELEAKDGHRFAAYLSEPTVKPIGSLVILQEIFGVNAHIQSVCDQYANEGYLAIAPALFDRQQRNITLDYSSGSVSKGREMKTAANTDGAMLDIEAAVEHVNHAGKVAVIGYCWGGFLAWLAASRLTVDASVCYYGGGIAQHTNEKPRCLVMMHFGKQDKMIPLSDVDAIRQVHPECDVHTYDADHGFNCDQRASYDAVSADLARERTLGFLAKVLL